MKTIFNQPQSVIINEQLDSYCDLHVHNPTHLAIQKYYCKQCVTLDYRTSAILYLESVFLGNLR